MSLDEAYKIIVAEVDEVIKNGISDPIMQPEVALKVIVQPSGVWLFIWCDWLKYFNAIWKLK